MGEGACRKRRLEVVPPPPIFCGGFKWNKKRTPVFLVFWPPSFLCGFAWNPIGTPLLLFFLVGGGPIPKEYDTPTLRG